MLTLCEYEGLSLSLLVGCREVCLGGGEERGGMGSAVLALAAWFPPCVIYTSKSTHLDAAEASTFAGLGVGLIYSIFFF